MRAPFSHVRAGGSDQRPPRGTPLPSRRVSRTRLVLDFLTRGEVRSYGPLRSQRADLYLPLGAGPHPVMVTIHGGAWHKRYGRSLMRGLAGDLVRRGWAVWNIEYRRLGEAGGGWPATFEDVAAAIDHLQTLDAPLDLDGVSFVGHSAGGHLALWAGALNDLMGGSPDEVPERYALADPSLLPPLAVPALLVHGTADRTISIKPARRYVERAQEAGASAELIEIEGAGGSHRAHVDPRSQAWTAVTRWLGQPAGL